MTKNQPVTYWSFQLFPGDATVQAYLDAFDRKHPTEKSLIELICGLYEHDDLNVCLHCGSFRLDEMENVRKRKCGSCFKIRHLTAGTFFHAQKNLRAMCKLIELLDHGIILSSPRIHKMLGIAQSSALQMMKKIMKVVENSYADEDNLVSTGVFSNVFCRRSNETPAHRHPISEQEAADDALKEQQSVLDQRVDAEKSRKEILDRLGGFHQKLYEQINSERQNTDDLSRKFPKNSINEIMTGLTMLQLSGLIESLPGDNFIRFDPGSSRNQNIRVKEKSINQKSFETIMTYIKKVSHGISRKHLPKYIASFWCFFNRDKWCDGALLRACIESNHIKDVVITTTVAPPLIQIPKWCMRLPEMF